MSVQISKQPGGFISIACSGIFQYSDLRAIQLAAKETFASGVKARCLVDTTGFTGWGQDGDWGDMAVVHETDHYVSKIAAIGTEESREQILMFLGAGRRKVAIEFFLAAELEKAREWLAKP